MKEVISRSPHIYTIRHQVFIGDEPRPCTSYATTTKTFHILPCLPPGRERGVGGSRASKCREAFRSLHTAGLLLALSLVLEFVASLLAFTEAVKAGALYGEVECGPGWRLQSLYQSKRVQDNCTEMDAPAMEAMGILGEFLNVGCEPTEAPTGEDGFMAQCSCPPEYDPVATASPTSEGCSYIGVEIKYAGVPPVYPDDDMVGVCLAITFVLEPPYVIRSDTLLYDDDGSYYMSNNFGQSAFCWAKNPAGTGTITILAFVVAVVGQLVESFVTWRYFSNPGKGPALMTAGSVFEAAGVVAVWATLINLPSFGEQGGVTDTGGLHADQKALHGLGVTAAAFAVIVAGYLTHERDCRSSRNTCLYYLGAFGSAAVWLGAAGIEVVVATFLIWKSEGTTRFRSDEGDWGVFGTSLAVFLFTEVLALFVMWAARFVWTRAKLLLLEPRELPVCRRKP